VRFVPAFDNTGRAVLHTIRADEGQLVGLMRWFASDPGHCRRGLDRCLASLAAAGMGPGAMHVVEQRKSSSANRNDGFRRCSAPWICFMDDDAELTTPATIQTMLDGMASLGASLAGPRLITGAGMLYSGLPYTNPLTLQTCVESMGEPDTGQCRETAIVPWLPSTVLLTHRAVMLACGGFDEAYQGSQHEDADFSLRARSRGFRCCYVGEAEAIHHNQLRNGHMSANSSYFRRRWKSRPELFWPEEAEVAR
jgi:GT2 family glycosyltransferase